MLIQAQIVDLLRDLQKRRDLTYLFISHDLRVVAALASRLIVMRNGKVVEEGAAAELFARSAERLHARAVRRGVQSEPLRGVVDGTVPGSRRWAARSRECRVTKGALALLITGGTENWAPARWRERFLRVCPSGRWR